MGEIQIKMDGEFFGATPGTLQLIAQHRHWITNGEDWPISYWFIQLMLAGF
jgi:hypothetical protein